MIAVIILISPINILVAVIAPKINELLRDYKYIGASTACIADADIQADNMDCFHETTDILEKALKICLKLILFIFICISGITYSR